MSMMWRRISAMKLAALLKAKEGEVLELVERPNNYERGSRRPDQGGGGSAVKECSVSGWSEVMTTKTLKTPDFSECIWRGCPDFFCVQDKCIIDKKNPMVVTRTYCLRTTIMGSAPLSHKTVISLNIKVLKSWRDNGDGTYIDVEPFVTKPERSHFQTYYEWYHHCFESNLYSGHTHNYKANGYGPSKELPPGPVEVKEEGVRIKEGQYVHNGTVL